MQRMFWFQLGGGALALQPRTWGGHANLQFAGWRFYANVGTSSRVSPRFMRMLRARWYGEAQLHCALAAWVAARWWWLQELGFIDWDFEWCIAFRT